MTLFGKKKEEAKTEPACCCSTATDTAEAACCCNSKEDAAETTCCGEKVNGICCIKVLGAGCKACHEQYENAKKAVQNLDLDVEVEYITDMEKVMNYGVMSMPALVVNDKIVSSGKVLKSKEVEALINGFKEDRGIH